jgi:prolyl-tRNA synthetase
MQRCHEIVQQLGPSVRVHLDDRDNYTPGFKFNHWELKGVPIRLNVGPKDVANNVVEVARRDTGEKIRNVSQNGLANELTGLLAAVQKSIYNRALELRQKNTFKANDYDEFKRLLSDRNCFIECYWAGSGNDEAKVKDETKATIRVIPFDQSGESGTCMFTGKPAKTRVIFGRAY